MGLWDALLTGFKEALVFLHNLSGNYGVAIIILTLGLRLILWPLTYSQAVSTKRMQELQPEIEKLRKKYKNDQEKLRQETVKLWKAYNVNPAAGCLPLFVQLPFLMAIYQVLLRFDAFKGAPFLWVPNLAVADPTMVLPVLSAVTTFFQSWLAMPRGGSQQPGQQVMVWMFPVMVFWITRSLPAGVGIYWVIGNLFTIGQQFLVPTRKAAQGGSSNA